MCGINGFNFRNEELITKMNKTLQHRGPDFSGIFLDDKVSLGHDRLSILDLSATANQPMYSNDKQLVIVFNGEIYNYLELKEQLKESYDFKTNSDTEVLLASYNKWGKDFVKKLNGIFAFCIYDKEDSSLFLARDHNGIKPLYYYHKDNQFIFSSELKGVLNHDISRILNLDAFNQLLRLQYISQPDTIIKNIYKLPPASWAYFVNNKLQIEQYWQSCPKGELKLNKTELAQQVKNQVQSAVKRQLISDRPLGIYLSGGIDSSAVLASACKERGDNIDTFSVGFDLNDGEEADRYNADFVLASKTAKFFNTNHHEVYISEKDVVDNFAKMVWHSDEPIPNPTALAMYKLAHFTKPTADVILGGDGGDELFGGYRRYQLSLACSLYQKYIPEFIRNSLNFNNKLGKLNTIEAIDRFALFFFQKDDTLPKVINKKYFNSKLAYNLFKDKYFSKDSDSQISIEEKLMWVDRNSWLVDHSLHLSDRMAMSAGLENRVPLLDKELIEFADTIPLKQKLSLFNTKIILKQAFKDELPEFLFNQPKRGWFSPGAKWLRRPAIKAMAEEALSKNYYEPTAELFDWEEVQKVLANHCDKTKYNLTIVWTLFVFQTWAKLYKIKLD